MAKPNIDENKLKALESAMAHREKLRKGCGHEARRQCTS